MKIFGITGWKNSGKTTLVAELVSRLSHLGFTVSTIKHVHCDLDIDHPGTDSFRHREAGAAQVLLASNQRWALMKEHAGYAEPELDDLLRLFDPVDLVIVEGFKMGNQPKIQVVRQKHNTECLPDEAQPIVAIASDEDVDPLAYNCQGPLLPLKDVNGIADFIIGYCNLILPE